MSARPLAVVCVSGGMDSAVTAAIAGERHRLALLHASYGQRTAGRELACFHALADRLSAESQLVIELPALASIGGSSLTDARIPVREGPPQPGVVPTSYVPFRNAHLLSAATSWAEVIGAEAVFIGAVWEDSSGYPDCRPEFYRAFEEVVRLGTATASPIHIETPIIHLTKEQIVRRGVQLGVGFDSTWSCYAREDVACGRCESCVLRLRAFRAAEVVDPIPYQPDAPCW
jgi:7-cyano-7-deazaguanine synthase